MEPSLTSCTSTASESYSSTNSPVPKARHVETSPSLTYEETFLPLKHAGGNAHREHAVELPLAGVDLRDQSDHLKTYERDRPSIVSDLLLRRWTAVTGNMI